jgi:hypothetical protein
MAFVTTYKQADLTLTGTMRKAQLAATATKTSRRPNGATFAISPAPSSQDFSKRRASSISTLSQLLQPEEKVKQCEKCHVKFSPMWWPADSKEPDEHRVLCHKCHWSIIHGNTSVKGAGSTEGNGRSLLNGVNGIQGPHVGLVV